MQPAFRLDGIGGPHDRQPVYADGASLGEDATGAMILVHGRGAGAEDILSLGEELARPGLALLAPQAADSLWFPFRYLEPPEKNEPWLSSALGAIETLLARVAAAGVPSARTCLLGFSQGACLVLEYARRHPARYGGVIGLSGALLGPDNQAAAGPGTEAGGLAGTPVFLGCSDMDPYFARYRVEMAAAELKRLGGDVTLHLYRGLGHQVNLDELRAVQDILRRAEIPDRGAAAA